MGKEAGLQVIVNRGAGNPLNDVCQQGGAGAVIEESCAGLVDLGLEEKVPHPLFRGRRHGGDTSAHAQDVPHGYIADGGDILILGEDVHQLVVQREQAFPDGNANSSAHVSFCQRVAGVAFAGGIGLPPAFGAHFAVAHDHQAMHLGMGAFQCVQEAEDGFGRDAHRFGCDPLKGDSVHVSSLLPKSKQIVFLCLENPFFLGFSYSIRGNVRQAGFGNPP